MNGKTPAHRGIHPDAADRMFVNWEHPADYPGGTVRTIWPYVGATVSSWGAPSQAEAEELAENLKTGVSETGDGR
jgi:hypothetical protein